MTTPKPVADQLREAIKESGLSLNALAKAADVPYASVHAFVNKPGKTVTIETAVALAKALRVKIVIG